MGEGASSFVSLAFSALQGLVTRPHHRGVEPAQIPHILNTYFEAGSSHKLARLLSARVESTGDERVVAAQRRSCCDVVACRGAYSMGSVFTGKPMNTTSARLAYISSKGACELTSFTLFTDEI